ncbi:threonine dehydrogenase-like Zn-dependent dehydrogenase [Rhodococcus rhodochrous J45]|uniref:Threonine dehydrogenase-like Zn-dependent dehydrogenase n=1 Tax=Rhodococcus rhodochrous J45 TaxID=935266 RepID=A0A562DIS7_RHORH|nr:alcohol dehydrogenase catalytic domain-containing protein [Rhodococcus rhodochrous]TWH09569.1 threonine dehydrogenase-like Zn-dependent dehydrogenase [Rhodococcus rhodochrous J45]
MRAAALLNGTIAATDIPEPPDLGPDQVLVAVHSCGICGSDLSLWKDAQAFVDVSLAGQNSLSIFDPTRPVVPGHEFSGTVVGCGENVEDFGTGDRVAGIGVATDPSTGEMTIIGYSNKYPGAFAERIVVDSAFLRHVPDGLSLDDAALAEPLHVGETHVQQSQYRQGETALVIGAGPIGLGVVIALAQRGCESIIVVEPSPKRRKLAAAFGATTVAAPVPGGPAELLPQGRVHSSAVAYECSGRQGAIDELTRTLPHGSRIQVVASPFKPETFIPVIAQWRQIAMNFGSGVVEDPYGITLDRLAQGVVDTSLLITGHVTIDDVGAAFASLLDPEDHVKILVHPESTVGR